MRDDLIGDGSPVVDVNKLAVDGVPGEEAQGAHVARRVRRAGQLARYGHQARRRADVLFELGLAAAQLGGPRLEVPCATDGIQLNNVCSFTESGNTKCRSSASDSTKAAFIIYISRGFRLYLVTIL